MILVGEGVLKSCLCQQIWPPQNSFHSQTCENITMKHNERKPPMR